MWAVSFDPAQDLARYQGLLAEAEIQVEVLRAVVSTLEAAVEKASGTKPVRMREYQPPTERRIQAIEVPPRRRRGTAAGGRGLKEVLRELYADGKRRNVDETIAELLERGMFTEDNIQKRASFTNRLNDLTNEGYLRQVRRGVHELASPNGSAESVDADGTTDPEPDGRQSSLQEGQGLESGPAGGTDHPPAGSQAIGATAGAARRT